MRKTQYERRIEEKTKDMTPEQKAKFMEKENNRLERQKAYFEAQRDRIHEQRVARAKYFFGDDADVGATGKCVKSFRHFIDEDNIIIVTSNVKYIRSREAFILIVDHNKAVYLKDWNVKELKNWYLGVDTYAIKLNRKYFKTYTFKSDFEDMVFEKEDTFDSLIDLAKEQDNDKTVWDFGHYGF